MDYLFYIVIGFVGFFIGRISLSSDRFVYTEYQRRLLNELICYIRKLINEEVGAFRRDFYGDLLKELHKINDILWDKIAHRSELKEIIERLDTQKESIEKKLFDLENEIYKSKEDINSNIDDISRELRSK
jgi:predicted  nucleic acid-binding Zn-ribbon protein